MNPLAGAVLGGLAITVAVVVLIGLVLVVAAAVSGGRNEVDPEGRRTTALYLGAVNWVALFMALFATLALVVSVVGYLGGTPAPRDFASAHGSISCSSSGSAHAYSGNSGSGSSGSGSSGNSGSVGNSGSGPSSSGGGSENCQSVGPFPTTLVAADNTISSALGSGLVAAAAAAVLVLYGRRLWDLIRDPAVAAGPAGRAVRTYLLAVSFLALFVMVLAGASVLFGLYRTIAPGVASGVGDRDPGLRELIDSAYLALGAFAIFRVHHRAAFPPPPPTWSVTGG